MSDTLSIAVSNDYATWRSGTAGVHPKWSTFEAEFANTLRCDSDCVVVKLARDTNFGVRLNEVSLTKEALYAVIVCDESVDLATPTVGMLAKQAVESGKVEGVVVFRPDPASPAAKLEPWLVVSLEHSLICETLSGLWPKVARVDVPDPNSLRFAVREIGKLQSHYTTDYWDPHMQARKAYGDLLANTLAARLNGSPAMPTLSADHHPGQGDATRAPYVRIYDPNVSPSSLYATYVCLFVSADGSSLLISVQSGATVWQEGGYKSIKKSMLEARSDEYYAALAADESMNEVLTRYGATRDFPIEGANVASGSMVKYKQSNVACSTLSIDSLASDTQIRDQVRAFVSLSEYLNSTRAKPDGRKTENGVSMIEKNIHWPKTRISQVLDSLRDKSPQVVLAGPPGTGKTFVARWFASELLGTPGQLDNDRITLVQFHPTYGYEDFVEGLRPVEGDHGVVFKALAGPIVKLAQAIQEDEIPRVLIIDEINRANIPRVFGELMYLLEYRDTRINLMLQEEFSLPRGLFIIATMNTADKSTRVMDVAMRRRFDFFALEPDVDVLRAHYESGTSTNDMGEELYEGFVKLNSVLREDLDKHRLIGHSFFMEDSFNVDTLRAKWDRQIGPLLDEYFFERKALESKYSIEGFWPSAAT